MNTLVIRTPEQIKEKLEFLESLRQIQAAYQMVHVNLFWERIILLIFFIREKKKKLMKEPMQLTKTTKN